MIKYFFRKLKAFFLAPKVPRSPSQVGELSNGFGAKNLLRSLEPCEGGIQRLERSMCLEGVQLLTRFCSIERPYWNVFLDHYRGLGVRKINVCVQHESEAEELMAMSMPNGLNLLIHLLPADCDPSTALHHLPFASLAEQDPFTLMVDADEYLQPLRPDLSIAQLAAVFPHTAQWFFPWLMRPCLDPIDQERRGFWGHVGKPLIRSGRMVGVAHDHAFQIKSSPQDQGPSSLPAGVFGFILVHYWSRSWGDALLKTFNNRFRDAKSADLVEALSMIQAGDLPVRLRLLAYLWVQNGYLHCPDKPLDRIDRDLEQKMLDSCLSRFDQNLCFESFQYYCEQLLANSHLLPLYPVIPLHALADRLPIPDTRID